MRTGSRLECLFTLALEIIVDCSRVFMGTTGTTNLPPLAASATAAAMTREAMDTRGWTDARAYMQKE